MVSTTQFVLTRRVLSSEWHHTAQWLLAHPFFSKTRNETEIQSAAPTVIILQRFSLFHYEAVLPGTTPTQHGATFLLSLGAHLPARSHSHFKRFLKTPISLHYHR